MLWYLIEILRQRFSFTRYQGSGNPGFNLIWKMKIGNTYFMAMMYECRMSFAA